MASTSSCTRGRHPRLPLVNVAIAFGAGILSFLSPSLLPPVPACLRRRLHAVRRTVSRGDPDAASRRGPRGWCCPPGRLHAGARRPLPAARRRTGRRAARGPLARRAHTRGESCRGYARDSDGTGACIRAIPAAASALQLPAAPRMTVATAPEPEREPTALPRWIAAIIIGAIALASLAALLWPLLNKPATVTDAGVIRAQIEIGRASCRERVEVPVAA